MAKHTRTSIANTRDTVDISGEARATTRSASLHRTAKALHLDYTKLKRLVDGNSAGKRKQATPAFIELVTATDRLPECIVEFENARGKKMRIHLRGVTAPHVTSLSRIFWSSRS
ncbi:MAG: hypothetical protein AUG08_00905 [Acidobacteria bacterium 13_1_20CM_2_55_15]|nr:MAG: hypothetical protein AUG08_00905 [Acidobacteria bacterium 13_1_20CM_2_55_15]